MDLLTSSLAGVVPAVLAHRLDARADVLAAARVPMLYLQARRDRLVGPRALAGLRRLRPDLVLEVLDAPHLVLQTRPAEAGAAIARFLSRGA